MKILPFSFLIIFSILLFTLSCENSTSTNSEDKLVGEWIWIQSGGGYFGVILNPDSVGYNLKIVFEKDGMYKEYKDDLLVIESHYEIEQKQYGANNEKRDFLIIEGNHVEQLIEFEDSNNLNLIDNCMDCYVHKYHRMSFF
jgi:hypothetical protein